MTADFAWDGFLLAAAAAALAGAAFWYSGLFTLKVMTLALFLMPVYGAALWIGSHAFRRAPEAVYRYAALLMCTVAAVIGLPLWR